MWQETGLTPAQLVLFRQRYPYMEIFSTPQINGSAGVSILWSTYKFGQPVAVVELVRHYAMLATIQTPQGPVHLVSVYIPPYDSARHLANLR